MADDSASSDAGSQRRATAEQNDKVSDGGSKSIVVLLVFLSMAGMMFGADTGTISGIVGMRNFRDRFGDVREASGDMSFSNSRKGLTIGSIYIGCFFGCFMSSPISDRFGKKKSVISWCFLYLVGVIIQLTSFQSFAQYVVGRVIDGLSIGALSVISPSYQSETSPPQVRGFIVATYQLLVTFGILVGYIITLCTHSRQNSSAWRIPVGINLAWGILFMLGVLFLPESPRHLMRIGKRDESHGVIARVMGRDMTDRAVLDELEDIAENVKTELSGGPVSWKDVFGKSIRYRTFLGIAVMALQQLTGNNYFFLFASSLFSGVGVSSSYVASLILGLVNFFCTFGGLYVLERFGRRKPLITGGLWMFVCLLIYASVGTTRFHGHTGETQKQAGITMICFTCFYIVGFSTTWAPCCYVIVGESYPLRLRSKCAALATASNWLFVFLISFCSSFISERINYAYGYVFAGFCIVASAVIYFFAKETKGLTLEEIDMLYGSSVRPWQSSAWAKEFPPLDQNIRQEIQNDKSRTEHATHV